MLNGCKTVITRSMLSCYLMVWKATFTCILLKTARSRTWYSQVFSATGKPSVAVDLVLWGSTFAKWFTRFPKEVLPRSDFKGVRFWKVTSTCSRLVSLLNGCQGLQRIITFPKEVTLTPVRLFVGSYDGSDSQQVHSRVVVFCFLGL